MAARTLLQFLPLNPTQLSPPNATSCDGAQEAWAVLHGVLPAFIIVICVGGLLGNLFVLSVLLLPRRRLSVAEIYPANLAASDLVFVSGLPFWAENIANRFRWAFGGPLCRLVNGVIKANLFVSIFLVVAISRDRYRALVHPVASQRRRRAQATCLLIWTLGSALSVPTFLFRSTVALPPRHNSCACVLLQPGAAWPWLRMVELNVLGFLLPLAALVFFNGHILASLRGRPGARKAAALILALVAAFLVCWTPYHFFAFLEFLYEVRAVGGCFWEDFINLGLQYANFFAFINSCLNLVIYVFVGRLFRTKAWELCQQCTPEVLLQGPCPKGQTFSNISGRGNTAGSHEAWLPPQ
ncbi:B1 bradykinin receptor [Neomonachus schauinslandi]|uniref:B1 bradykinin receptor n=1 Tax=Neomonachus schauinslandi TaxID=29088 RepID=A0A2Y9GB73_NEOSC|nr:B1 bradykinin receptor [Neomonachus schauinslandi]